MASTTSSVRTSRHHELSPMVALLLTIVGNIVVIAIAAVGLAGVALAAIAVFGPRLMDLL